VTPQAERFLQNAEDHLKRGRIMVADGLNDDSGRAAYLAGFHAAQALIFERTGKVLKSHKAVNIEFLRLTKDEPHFSPERRGFLSRAYDFKAVADYDVGPIAEVSSHEAVEALEAARKFVASVRHVLAAPRPN
jgi:uncharacterized protein (UPF0332 family)